MASDASEFFSPAQIQFLDKFAAVAAVLLAAWAYADSAALFWTLFLSLAALKLWWQRAESKPSTNQSTSQRNLACGRLSEAHEEDLDAAGAKAAGVPAQHLAQVAELGRRVSSRGQKEPLCDPLMLLRFLKARDFDVGEAVRMYRETIRWRANFSIQSVMMIFGAGETYTLDGNRATEDATSWRWHPELHSREASLTKKYGFFGRLSQRSPNGEPVAIWRLGAADLDGYVREDLVSIITRGFVSHLEDLLQCGRAESLRRKQLVQARLLIDAKGLGLQALRHRAMIKQIISTGKNNFPEVNVSVTIIRAPYIFAKLWGLAQSHLTPAMQRKICILGEDFVGGLQKHAGLEQCMLPAFLGGQGRAEELCDARRVPPHLAEVGRDS